MSGAARLNFFCGKMAAGKSTLADHELHAIEVSAAPCKHQLGLRSRDLPPGTPWTTDAEFDAITAYFQPPSEDERFTIVRHGRE